MNKQEIEKVLDGLKRMRIAMFNYCIDGERIKPFLDTAISALESQLNNGWIPCKSKLPKEGRYLVTTAYGEVKESEFDLKKWWQIDNSKISLEWEEEPIEVLAWRELPDPYKEVSE